jgi:hypothetical protein
MTAGDGTPFLLPVGIRGDQPQAGRAGAKHPVVGSPQPVEHTPVTSACDPDLGDVLPEHPVNYIGIEGTPEIGRPPTLPGWSEEATLSSRRRHSHGRPAALAMLVRHGGMPPYTADRTREAGLVRRNTPVRSREAAARAAGESL